MNREAKVGLFVLVCAAVMAYFILRTTDFEKLLGGDTGNREVRLELSDASGIREGTSVEIAGVRVGRVEGIELEGDKAIAVLSIPRDMVFLDGAAAELKTKGVLGDRYVSLISGSGQPAPDQDRLVAKVPAGLDDITDTIQNLGENLLEITDLIKEGLESGDENNRITEISGNIERLTQALVDMAAENRANVQTTTGQVAELSGSLNRDIPALIAELANLVRQLQDTAGDNRPQIDEALANVAEASRNLTATTRSISSIADKVDRGEGTVGALLNDKTTVEKLNSVLDTADESVKEVQGLVRRVTDLKIEFAADTLYFTEQGGFQGTFGFRFKPNDRKYYLVEAVGLGGELITDEFREITIDTFDADGNLIETNVSREKLDADDLLFNAQLAYGFGPTFLRAGIFESELGAAFDYVQPSNRFQLSLAAWDFGDELLDPSARLQLTVPLSYKFRLHVGYDDFLNTDQDSLILGGGLNWNDEDLKVIIGGAGRLFR